MYPIGGRVAVAGMSAVEVAEGTGPVAVRDEHAAPAPMICPNCGNDVAGSYCSVCGQSRHDHSRSLLEVFHELIEHHLFVNGKTARTLIDLCLNPGELTRAYIEGRRVRYLPPIRLYLFASLAFFLTLWAGDVAILQFRLRHVEIAGDVAVGLAQVEAEATNPKAADGTDVNITIAPQTGPDGKSTVDVPVPEILRPAHKGFEAPESWRVKLIEQDDTLARVVHGAFFAMAHPKALNPVLDTWLPRLMVLLLPVAAFWLMLVNWRRHLYFVDHLTFTLHGQAFAFLFVSLIVGLRLALPDLPYIPAAVGVITLAYTLIAWRRVYGDGWIMASIKMAVVGTVFLTLLSCGLLGILLYGFATITP